MFDGTRRAYHRRREIGFKRQMQGDGDALLRYGFDAVGALRLDFGKLRQLGEGVCQRLHLAAGKHFDVIDHLAAAPNLADDFKARRMVRGAASGNGAKLFNDSRCEFSRLVQAHLAALAFEAGERCLDALGDLFAESGNRFKTAAIGKGFQLIKTLDAEVAVERLRCFQADA